jgi:hypothetical protein
MEFKLILHSIGRFLNSEEIASLNAQITQLKDDNEVLKTKLGIALDNAKVTFPKSLGKITLNEQMNILKTLTYNIQITDQYLQLTSVEEAKKFSAETKVALRTWTPEDHDCDNFAAALWGYYNTGLWSYAFGYARSAGHAFNIMIDNEKKIWIVEPQTNQYLTLEQAKARSTPDGLSYYPITFIQM